MASPSYSGSRHYAGLTGPNVVEVAPHTEMIGETSAVGAPRRPDADIPHSAQIRSVGDMVDGKRPGSRKPPSRGDRESSESPSRCRVRFFVPPTAQNALVEIAHHDGVGRTVPPAKSIKRLKPLDVLFPRLAILLARRYVGVLPRNADADDIRRTRIGLRGCGHKAPCQRPFDKDAHLLPSFPSPEQDLAAVFLALGNWAALVGPGVDKGATGG